MNSSNIKIDINNYLFYKFLNSLFLGLSVGSVFTLYTPLKPSIYSLGGIALAVGMLFVARIYPYIMNLKWFFRLSLFVELAILAVIIYFLLNPYRYFTALLIYVGYQVTFTFGSYLVRAETLAISGDKNLSNLDSAKQIGYLVGMLGSYIFYKVVENFYSISDKQEQVYSLHFILLLIELFIILFIFKSFNSKKL